MTELSPEKLKEAVYAALATVIDPEIRRPITELDMIRKVEIDPDGTAKISIDLTAPGCPLKDRIRLDTQEAVKKVPNITAVEVIYGVMTDEQRKALREKLTGVIERDIPFTKPGSTTRIYAISSGKGGVGKSSLTANLAAGLADQGLKVAVIDADIYGFSIPRMLGITEPPTSVDGLLIPPIAHEVKVISIGMFVQNRQPVIWRGPMLHRSARQFLTDVFWGDLDILLLDLPSGTGDMAISIAQLLPNAQILVVTTPQIAAAEVAERSGLLALHSKQKVVGVVENMSYLLQPDGSKLEIFGSGGGQEVSAALSQDLGYQVPLLAQIPMDIALRCGSDEGKPVVLTPNPDSGSAAAELQKLVKIFTQQEQGLNGRPLSVTPL